MNVWVVTIGEPLPIDGDNVRLYRTGILCDLLISKGHKVTWWTSTFDHNNKKNRYNKNTSIEYNKSLLLNLLYSIPYKKNISIQRLINHHGIARKFSKFIYKETKPDIIICSFPPIELCEKAVSYGNKMNVPVIIDARDMWPDIFLRIAPSYLNHLMRLVLSPLFKKTKNIFKNAYAIFGITPAFVQWGLNYAGREMNPFDKDFPLAYNQEEWTIDSLKSALKFWENIGIDKRKYKFIACFFGSLNRQFEIETVIKAAQRIKQKDLKVLFVICGAGDNLSYYKELAKKTDNFIFPGWVGRHEIQALMSISSIGLAPYHSREDFMASLPNKSIEYLSAGLPILSSLRGALENLLNENNCGMIYENNNADDLVDKLIYLYNNPSTLRQMSKNALKFYKKKFVAKKVYGEMISHLEKIVKEYNKDKRSNVS